MPFLAPLVPLLIEVGVAGLGASAATAAIIATSTGVLLSYAITSIEKNKSKKRLEDRQASTATMSMEWPQPISETEDDPR